jgi:hypothetical protein
MRGGFVQPRFGHRHGGWLALLHGQFVEVVLQRDLQRIGGHVLVPARITHRLQHHRRGVACLGLFDDPAAQLGRDGLPRGTSVLVGCRGAVRVLFRTRCHGGPST